MEPGDLVLVHGLTSEAGQSLNGQLAKVTQLANESGRLEVSIGGSRLLRLKPENLQLAEEVDGSQWAPGDQARVVGLHDGSGGEELQKLNSSLALLQGRILKGKWLVKVQKKVYTVRCRNLRVCTESESARWGILGPCPWLTGAAALATALVLIGTELSVRRVRQLHGAEKAPGLAVAALPMLAVLGSFSWIVGTVAGCYVMHESLQDPEVRFPQISELAVGPAAAKMLYRVGFASAAMLLAAVVQMHSELALPQLPGGQNGDDGESFTFYGFIAALGVGLQGVALLEPDLSLQTLAHLGGALAFFYGAWCHMGAAQKLYLPTVPAEDSPGYQEALDALEAAEESKLLNLPVVHFLVLLRHKVLMRGPILIFLAPIISQFMERTESSSGGQSPRIRSLMGLVQWLVVLNFALIFVSYGPELSAAAFLTLPDD